MFAMFRPSSRSLLFAGLLASLFLPVAARADYKGAIVVDAASGAVLEEENADTVSPPASVTKLMTFLVVHDAVAAGQVRLDTPITATAADQSMGGTQVNLAAGETFRVEELLYALMVESANDAAHALTQGAGGREAFVARMNARARSLGMTNTVFRSPHGLPPDNRKISDGDLASPRDLALLARELVSKTDVLRYTSVRVRPFGAGVRAASDAQPQQAAGFGRRLRRPQDRLHPVRRILPRRHRAARHQARHRLRHGQPRFQDPGRPREAPYGNRLRQNSGYLDLQRPAHPRDPDIRGPRIKPTRAARRRSGHGERRARGAVQATRQKVTAPARLGLEQNPVRPAHPAGRTFVLRSRSVGLDRRASRVGVAFFRLFEPPCSRALQIKL